MHQQRAIEIIGLHTLTFNNAGLNVFQFLVKRFFASPKFTEDLRNQQPVDRFTRENPRVSGCLALYNPPAAPPRQKQGCGELISSK